MKVWRHIRSRPYPNSSVRQGNAMATVSWSTSNTAQIRHSCGGWTMISGTWSWRWPVTWPERMSTRKRPQHATWENLSTMAKISANGVSRGWYGHGPPRLARVTAVRGTGQTGDGAGIELSEATQSSSCITIPVMSDAGIAPHLRKGNNRVCQSGPLATFYDNRQHCIHEPYYIVQEAGVLVLQ